MESRVDERVILYLDKDFHRDGIHRDRNKHRVHERLCIVRRVRSLLSSTDLESSGEIVLSSNGGTARDQSYQEYGFHIVGQ